MRLAACARASRGIAAGLFCFYEDIFKLARQVTCDKPRCMKRRGFTLVEIMIVVAIIGLLAMIAVPAFMRARKEVQATRFMNDLRVAVSAFTLYVLENNGYPPDQVPGVIPPGMGDYLRGMKWSEPTSIGGQWDWDYEQFGYHAGVSVYQPARSDAEMREIDARIDDGNLATGVFRQRSQGYIYIIEF